MKLLLVYPPFCTPTVMPYSISYLKDFIKNNSEIEVKCLDLNAKFHTLRFPKHYSKLKRDMNFNEYDQLLSEFDKDSRAVYADNNKEVVRGNNPVLFNEMLELILKEKSEYVAFSLVYNSQCFYTLCLIEELTRRGIRCIVGGPSVNSKLEDKAVPLENEIELIEYLNSKKFPNPNYNTVPDFSDYSQDDYLSKEIIIPLKSCTSCYYKQCTFCTHHHNQHYFEFDIGDIKNTIIKSKAKYFFFIDDMISKKRLQEIAKAVKPLNIIWWCQLRPTKDLIPIFEELYESGLRCISWGVESGNQRILDLIKKGTDVQEVKEVLKASHEAKIKNVAYIMFGFPTETKEEFMNTIDFLKENQKYIDLVSTTIFGLQKGSKIYENPKIFGITEIKEEKRTVLDEKIHYHVEKGLQNEEVKKLRSRYIKTIKNIDKLPRVFNYFKEQIILLD